MRRCPACKGEVRWLGKGFARCKSCQRLLFLAWSGELVLIERPQ